MPDAGAAPKRFQFKPLWQRALIVVAGPLTNLLIALAIFAGFFMAYGKPVPVDPADTALVRKFAEVSVARDAGMRLGDRIVAIDGQRLTNSAISRTRLRSIRTSGIVVGVERPARGQARHSGDDPGQRGDRPVRQQGA